MLLCHFGPHQCWIILIFGKLFNIINDFFILITVTMILVFTFFVMTLTFYPLTRKMYRYFPQFILHLRIRYESSMLKTTGMIVSEPVLTKFSLTPWPMTIYPLTQMLRYLPLTIRHLFMKFESLSWKLIKLSCQNQSVDKVSLDLDLWPLDTKIYRHLPLTILHQCMKDVYWKQLELSCQNQSVDKVKFWPGPLIPWPQNE